MRKEQLKERIKENIVCNVDGFYYYWPKNSSMYAPYLLRQIADILDDMNAPYEKELWRYFNS